MIDQATLATARRQRKRSERWIVAAALVVCTFLVLAVYAWAVGPSYLAYWSYTPQEGDIVFQSLPRNRLVNAIEGATQSSYSHCGIVARRDGRWIVYEAYDGVEATPLKEFLFRGRNHGFAVYRLKSPYQGRIPAILARVQGYLGRPYDVRYRMDDEKIYCSELIYKAYRESSDGEQLGRLVRLGDLNWEPYVSTIEHFEQGPVPLDREMITPIEMARAEQLELVFAHDMAQADR